MLLQITQFISTAIPLVTFAALFASVFIYVRSKGSMDALKEVGNTYKDLAEAYSVQIKELESKIDSLEREIALLKDELAAQRAAMKIAVSEFTEAVRGATNGH